MPENVLLRPQFGPQMEFINTWDDIPLVFYGGEMCASLFSNR